MPEAQPRDEAADAALTAQFVQTASDIVNMLVSYASYPPPLSAGTVANINQLKVSVSSVQAALQQITMVEQSNAAVMSRRRRSGRKDRRGEGAGWRG